jgi:hypothetical protein
MKTIYTFIFFSLTLIGNVIGQTNNLVVYTNEPLPFYLILNGVRQNNEPQTNVRVVGLEESNYRFRVVFANGQVRDIDRAFSFLEKNEEVSFEVVRRKKKYATRFAGTTALTSAAPAVTQAQQQHNPTMPQAPVTPVSSGHASEMPQAPVTPQSSGNSTQIQTSGNVNVSGQQNPATTTTQTTTTNGAAGGNISINVSETGFNMNVNIQDPNAGTTNTSTTTTTTTSTTSNEGGFQLNQNMTITESSSTSTSSNQNVNINTNTSGTMGANQDTGGSRPNSNQTSRPIGTQTVNSGAVYVRDYNGRIGCNAKPLMNLDAVKKTALSEPFSEGRFGVVENAMDQNCMTVEQVISLSEVFTFEEDKMKFIQMAYDVTYDLDNYGTIRPIFTFSDSRTEFDQFLRTKR